MKDLVPAGSPPERYRSGYLKLKSVLFDRATGLAAIPVLLDDLRAMLDAREALGVLHVEITELETVESLYGWQVVDRIVARVADELRSAVGRLVPQASLLAVNAVAGDRFVVFVPGAEGQPPPDAAWLGQTAHALRGQLEDAFGGEAFAGLNPQLGFHAGHALLSIDPFYRFERCVYAAVEKARADHAQRERRRDLSWGEELHKIIQLADVDTLFQPLVALDDGTLLGYEAFARGPKDTLFEAPRAMFALSDRVGISVELDRMCCEAALRAFGKLGQRGKLFLNVLPASLEQDRWRHEKLLPLLRSLALQPADLVLEVSERSAGPDLGAFCSSLARFQDEGFAVALDDVGTGRTDLETIERLRPSYLKLDVSLVRNIEQSLIQQEVLLTLSALAERIDASVVAEGVETEPERLTLIACGARYGQGYLFATPSPELHPPRAPAVSSDRPAASRASRPAVRRPPEKSES